MRTSRRLVVALLCALPLAVLWPGGAAARVARPDAHAARRPLIGAAVVGPRPQGRRLPRSFVGFAIEYHFAPFYLGDPIAGANRAMAGLMANIAGQGSGRPVVRIGGGSSDDSWWNPDRRPSPRGVTFSIDRDWLAGVQAFERLTRSPLVLGLNFAANNPSIATAWARTAISAFGRRTLFELGNEPDLYTFKAYGTDSRGRRVYARSRPYRFSEYLNEFGRTLGALRGLSPRPRVLGPAICCDATWDRALRRFMRRFGRKLAAITFHAYPLGNCPGLHTPYPKTIGTLLAEGVVSGYRIRYDRILRRARGFHRGLLLSETNSFACGGKENVSDTFASALWGLDWLFQLDWAGVNGAQFNSISPAYAPFNFDTDLPRTRVARVFPLYYGILFFSQATRGRARLILVIPSLRVARRSHASVKFYGTRRGRRVRVVVLNKDLYRSGLVRVRIRGARRNGTLSRLTAPSLASKTGVTLAGQTIPDRSRDGRLVGPRQVGRVRRRGRGLYVFWMPRASAAILTVRLGR